MNARPDRASPGSVYGGTSDGRECRHGCYLATAVPVTTERGRCLLSEGVGPSASPGQTAYQACARSPSQSFNNIKGVWGQNLSSFFELSVVALTYHKPVLF